SPLHALALADRLTHDKGRDVWVAADIRDAFGSVPINRLLDIVRVYLPDDGLLCFLKAILGGAKNPGLRQGGPLSPLLLNLYLHHHLDRKWRRLHPDVPLLRYADDILLMCRTQAEARKAHDDLVELLLPAGMLVKGDRKSDVVTLTPERPALWLGFHFEKRGKKGLRVLVAEKSWE